MNNTRAERLASANKLIACIAAHGRGFFMGPKGNPSRIVERGKRLYWADASSGKEIYLHYQYRWRGFSGGGTLKQFVEALKVYIMAGEKVACLLGPWPKWVCKGDLWSYGEDMKIVREEAIELGVYCDKPTG